MQQRDISELINRHNHGYSLAQAFYRDPHIYQLELDNIFLKSWQYAGHVSEIPYPGDYFLFEYGNESVIMIRDKADEIHALMNVCRHRGSRVCLEKKGKANRLVCRYHAWTYGLNGDLKNARYLAEGIDKSGLGLHRAHIRILYGLIYVNLAGDPATFDPIERELGISLQPYRLENAKVAHRQTYTIKANWKLAVENYCECYHCAPAHPEYSKAHSLALPDAKYSEEMDALMDRSTVCGLSDHMVLQIFDEAEMPGADYGYERYPLLRGHVTGSKDGKPVAPLLGDIKDYDGGTTDFQVGPINFALAYCDHVVVYRFTPVSQYDCECDISWLVNGDAEEGKDYNKEELTWLWDVTTLADKHIIERNQQGVNSHFYQPGPFSTMENRIRRLHRWYLDTLKLGLS